MGTGPHPMKLLGDEAPARAALEGEDHVASSVEAPQPRSQLLAVGGDDLAPDRLAGVGVQIVDRDLTAVNVEPFDDSHGDLLELRQLSS